MSSPSRINLACLFGCLSLVASVFLFIKRYWCWFFKRFQGFIFFYKSSVDFSKDNDFCRACGLNSGRGVTASQGSALRCCPKTCRLGSRRKRGEVLVVAFHIPPF